jgi:chemotaxis regulatin CheY-phosphate phosphatase CheZ
MTEVSQFTDADYQELRRFVARTPRGRAFLKEHETRARTMAVEEVHRLFSEIRESLRRHQSTIDSTTQVEVLRRELLDMSASIVQARREIAALRPKDGESSDRIVTATNELDAIVQSTERASFEILNAAERIMEISNRLRAAEAPDELCLDLENQVMNIFTACSFQDLTGQRTTKVVNALRYIEQRIMAMMGIWSGGGGDSSGEAPPAEPEDKRPDAHLLNGPSDDGIDQGAVDRLLNGLFDAAPAAASPPPRQPAPRPAPPPEPEIEHAAMGQGDIDSLFP